MWCFYKGVRRSMTTPSQTLKSKNVHNEVAVSLIFLVLLIVMLDFVFFAFYPMSFTLFS